jgi:hypothetical protein
MTAQSAVEVFLAVAALLLLGRDLRRAWRIEDPDHYERRGAQRKRR